MKKIIVLILIVFLSAGAYAQQQGDQAVYVNWNFGAPINNHFVNSFTGNGAAVGYSTFI